MRKRFIVQPYAVCLEVFIDDGGPFQRSEIGREFKDFGDSPASGFSCRVDVEEDGTVFRRFAIWLDKETVDVDIIAHECYHTATDILGYVGVKDEEAMAYLLGYLTQMIADMVWEF